MSKFQHYQKLQYEEQIAMASLLANGLSILAIA